MSIYITKEKKLVIESSGFNPINEHVQRITALIALLQQRADDFTDADTPFFALELLQDMLPSEAQLTKGLAPPSAS